MVEVDHIHIDEDFGSKLLLVELDKTFDHQVDRYDSKLLLLKLLHRVELELLLLKHQVMLEI